MIRRSPQGPFSRSTRGALPQFALGQRRIRKVPPKALSGDSVVAVLVTLALLLLVVSYSLSAWFSATPALHSEHDSILRHWEHQDSQGGNRHPIAADEHPQLKGHDPDAVDAFWEDHMNGRPLIAKPSSKSKVTGTSWVEGEQLLKQSLKELADRQAQGLDIGVPVLTRYLGPDVPAWPKEGTSKEEWQKKVDEKYAAMREEENEWITQMNEYLKTSTVG